MYPTDAAEVGSIIDELKTKKAAGFDGIGAKTLKEIKSCICKPLSYLSNLYFETGIFPDVLKVGAVKPIHKGGSKMDVINYRPITVISNIAKVVEKLLAKRMNGFLEKFNIISPNQYGFRPNRSTQDAIKEITSFIYERLDSKTPTIGVFVDLSKAFDTVCHRKLLEKLYRCGFRGVCYDLFESYLNDRQQFVEVNGFRSSMKNISYGIPQGTVLGPIMFTIYVNSLLKKKLKGRVISFADDTVLLFDDDTWQSLKIKVEEELTEVCKWFRFHTLTLNAEKTGYMIFNSYSGQSPDLGSLMVSPDVKIREQKTVKYLGIILDQHMRWDHHVGYMVNKIRFLLGRFAILRRYLNFSQLRTLYFSLVQSQLTYGILGWGGARGCHLRKVEIVQKWVLKIIMGRKKTYSTSRIYQESGVMTVTQLYVMQSIIDAHKNNSTLQTCQHTYGTRSRQNVIVPRARKAIGQRHYTYLSPRLYNSAPSEFKTIWNLKRFKTKIVGWILQRGSEFFHAIINSNHV